MGVKIAHGVGHQPEGELGHVLGAFLAAPAQPVFNQAHAPGHAVGVGVFQIVHPLGEGLAQRGQAVVGEHLLNAVQKGDVPVGAQQGGADLPVLKQDGEDVLNEGEAVFVEGAHRVGADGVQNLLEQLVLHAFQHIINIGIVQVEGGAVDVHQVHQLLHRHLVHALLGHQLGKTVAQLGLGAADAPVRLFLHGCASFHL